MTETEIDHMLESLVLDTFPPSQGIEVRRRIVRSGVAYDVELTAVRGGRFAGEAHAKLPAALTYADVHPHLAHVIALLDEVISIQS